MSQLEKDTTLSFTEPTDYSGCIITDIKRRKGAQADRIGAILRDKNGQMLIAADLEYIVEKLHDRMAGKPEEDNEL